MKAMFVIGVILTLGFMWTPASLGACDYNLLWQTIDSDEWGEGWVKYGCVGGWTPYALASSWMESGGNAAECEAWIEQELTVEVVSGACLLTARYDTSAWVWGNTSSGDWWGYAWAASGPSGCFYYDAYASEEDKDDSSGGIDWDYATLYDEDTYSHVQLSHAEVGIHSGTGIEITSEGSAKVTFWIDEAE